MPQPIYRINLIEWTTCRSALVLIPEGFKGIVLVIPSNPKDRKFHEFNVRRIANLVYMVAEWSDEYEGWIIQYKGPRD